MTNSEGGEIELKEAQEVALLVKTGLTEERHVTLAHGASLLAIVETVARERGKAIEEFILIREGEDVELALDLKIEADYPHHRRHHIHHKSQVKVVVFYNGKDASREFKRSATVEDVLLWAVAVKEFNIDAGMAAEFELARQGVKEELPGSEHIGHVAGYAKVLELDLVRGDIANG